MNRIIKILMNRDGISYKEAEQMYFETKEELMDFFDGVSILSAEEILMNKLGLEEDYIFDFI
jgi:hypothetical protein